MDTSVHTNFHTLGLSEALLQDLASAGFTSPTPIQEQAIPPALAGRDVIGCAQTGILEQGGRRAWQKAGSSPNRDGYQHVPLHVEQLFAVVAPARLVATVR